MTDFPIVVLSNRCDMYVLDALASIKEKVTGGRTPVIIDDSGSGPWRDRMMEEGYTVLAVDEEPAGYTRAMNAVWDYCRTLDSHVFFFEEDFTIEKRMDLAWLARVLEARPNLAQVALQRPSWYPVEHENGGMIPALYAQGVEFRRATLEDDESIFWLEHDYGFTGNPCLISRRAFRVNWPSPDEEWTEWRMSNLLRDAGFSFAYWGNVNDLWVTHHGHHRAATSSGY